MVVENNRTDDGRLHIRWAGPENKPLLVKLLDQVKTHFEWAISQATDVEDFSLWRSGRQGATTEAHKQGVPQPIINLMGR